MISDWPLLISRANFLFIAIWEQRHYNNVFSSTSVSEGLHNNPPLTRTVIAQYFFNGVQIVRLAYTYNVVRFYLKRSKSLLRAQNLSPSASFMRCSQNSHAFHHGTNRDSSMDAFTLLGPFYPPHKEAVPTRSGAKMESSRFPFRSQKSPRTSKRHLAYRRRRNGHHIHASLSLILSMDHHHYTHQINFDVDTLTFPHVQSSDCDVLLSLQWFWLCIPPEYHTPHQ